MIETDTHVYFVCGYLSNWYPCTSYGVIGGQYLEFNCSEQAFMAHKAWTFRDTESFEAIMRADHPNDQKAIGRQVKGFNADVWMMAAPAAMFEACKSKFFQNPHLRIRLQDTQDKVLVEAAHYDRVWGVGLRETDPLIRDEKNWRGMNWLGKTLMIVRDRVNKKSNESMTGEEWSQFFQDGSIEYPHGVVT